MARDLQNPVCDVPARPERRTKETKTEQPGPRAMENPAYLVLSRQMGLQRQMDVIANNLANTNTSGFKGERLMFSEFLTPKATNPGVTGDGARISFAGVAGTVADTREGTIQSTGNLLDFAIKGSGFFVVDTPSGPRYTRDGHFELDGQGQLINRDGFPVLSQGGGTLSVPAGATSIEVTPTGTLSSDKGAIGALQIVRFDNEGGLKKTGLNLFETDQAPQRAEGITVLQNAVEASNVQPIIELSKMIEVQRAYQSAQQMLDNEHDRKSRTISVLTKTN
jgi:flagellar basal-body rod protein FlgF